MQIMRRLNSSLFFLFMLASLGYSDSLRVLTWNMHDFPSGAYNLRKPKVEGQNIAKAASIIRTSMPHIILIQEIRDSATCLSLIDSLDTLNYTLLVCSLFKDNAGIPTFQQVAIIARLPLISSSWKNWVSFGVVEPPRGFAYAIIRFDTRNLLVCNVHLKSNRTDNTNIEKANQLNILKRELSIEQFLRFSSSDSSLPLYSLSGFIFGGDFNTNADNLLFVSENTIPLLDRAGYHNCFSGIPFSQRITYPSKGYYPDATFDYIFIKGLVLLSSPLIFENDISDHFPLLCVMSYPIQKEVIYNGKTH